MCYYHTPQLAYCQSLAIFILKQRRRPRKITHKGHQVTLSKFTYQSNLMNSITLSQAIHPSTVPNYIHLTRSPNTCNIKNILSKKFNSITHGYESVSCGDSLYGVDNGCTHTLMGNQAIMYKQQAKIDLMIGTLTNETSTTLFKSLLRIRTVSTKRL